MEVDEEEKVSNEETIPFTMKKTEIDVAIEFLVHGVQSINDLELDISPNCVKLKIKDSNKKVEISLDKKVNVNQVKAKMAKKEGKLKVTLPYG